MHNKRNWRSRTDLDFHCSSFTPNWTLHHLCIYRNDLQVLTDYHITSYIVYDLYIQTKRSTVWNSKNDTDWLKNTWKNPWKYIHEIDKSVTIAWVAQCQLADLRRLYILKFVFNSFCNIYRLILVHYSQGINICLCFFQISLCTLSLGTSQKIPNWRHTSVIRVGPSVLELLVR